MYEVQPGKCQDGKKRRELHRCMFLPCESILEEPERFQFQKENNRSQNKQLVTSLPIIPVTQETVPRVVRM